MCPQSLEENVRLSATNIGGIDQTTLEIPPGLTILEGRNATNRTSLLQAVMAALGSDNVALKSDATEGAAEISFNGETYSRSLKRTNGTTVADGDPYLDDPEIADLFAFLLETNEARRAVARDADLRELIMNPVDTGSIKAEINKLKEQKEQLDEEIAEVDSLQDELPSLEQKRNHIESQIQEKKAELKELKEKMAAVDGNVQEKREKKAELEEKFSELRNARSDLEEVRFDIDTEKESLESLKQEKSDLQDDLRETSDDSGRGIDEIESQISTLRTRKRTLDSEIKELQSTIQFNEEMLEEADDNPIQELSDESDSTGAITDQLVEKNEAVACWTCGSQVNSEQIRSTLDSLRELRKDKVDRTKDIEREIDQLSNEKKELKRQRQRKEDLTNRLANIEDEIGAREDNIEQLRDQKAELKEEIEDLETEIETLEDQDFSEILDLHKEINQLEFEIDNLNDEREEVVKEIDSVEARIGEKEEIENERTSVQNELKELRNKIDRIEQEAVEQFNNHMEKVLDLLEYDNIERIWIERKEKTVRQGRRKVEKSAFDLHIVRESDSGTAYEDTVDHLSQSEREVTGLIFALAGYLVHDLSETLPFLLLDSLEAIDSERIAALIDYLEDHATYLIVALLPEDANAIDSKCHRITEI